VEGRVTGTAADGALLVDTDTGSRRFHGGEVSVRASSSTATVGRDA
jgi:hypothetical protein